MEIQDTVHGASQGQKPEESEYQIWDSGKIQEQGQGKPKPSLVPDKPEKAVSTQLARTDSTVVKVCLQPEAAGVLTWAERYSQQPIQSQRTGAVSLAKDQGHVWKLKSSAQLGLTSQKRTSKNGSLC